MNLPLGCFLNAKTDELVQFPDFKQRGKPYEIKIEQPPPREEKPKGILQKIKDAFNPKLSEIEPYDYNTEYAEEEEEWNEFLTTEEEWEEDW